MHLVIPPGGSFREVRRVELGPRALTIGRREGCDVRLDVPGVDEEHAKISEVALVALGPDCAVGDVPLDPGGRRLVMPGDEIQIGSVVLALEGDDPSLAPPPPDAAQEIPALGRPRSKGPRVRVVEGQNFGDELVLEQEKREYVIGRAPKCDLVLEDREVSREHIKVVRRGYSVFLQDQTSTRGSWLGRSTVYPGATIEWARPRMLKVGATVLALELPEEIRKAAPAAQPSAPMTPEPRRRAAAGGSPPPAAVSSRPPPPGAPLSSRPPPGGAPEASSLHYDPTPPPVAVASIAGAAAPQGAAPVPAAAPARAGGSRRAWKRPGVTFGKASGLLMLALAGLAIAGGLFVVFSLLE